MAENVLIAAGSPLIDGRYAVDMNRPWPEAGGGLTAFHAQDRLAADGARVAIAVTRDASPRARALKALAEPIDNLMVPLGHGVLPKPGGAGQSYFIVCMPPPGPPVSAPLNAWPERVVIDLVLRPAARVLETLAGRKLTHRAIRPNNVFQAAPGQPVTLGAAWAAPPARHQPAVFEPPYSAVCHPAGRGDGSIADDVYALGVLLLSLYGGRMPLADMPEQAVVRWKMELGSFALLTRDIPVSGSFAELLRGMLAEDPEHRPLPSQLLDLAHLRGRRLATRPARRSQNALMLDDMAVLDARMLAYALHSDPRKAVQFLRNGLVAQWLRRSLGDVGLATQVEDLVRRRQTDTDNGLRADPVLVMQTIHVLNPRMPLCWRGIALWPDGLASLLAEGVALSRDLAAAAEEVVSNNIVSIWVAGQGERERGAGGDLVLSRGQASGPGGVFRLYYAMNPMLPCHGQGMEESWVLSVPDLLLFLERHAGAAGEVLIDTHLAAFVAARADRRIELVVDALLASKDAAAFRHNELALLQEMQGRYHPGPLPGLGAWVAERLKPELELWRNRPRREAMKSRLDALARDGILGRLIQFVEDIAARSLDAAGARRAAEEVAMIDAEVAAIEHDGKLRFAVAERHGQAIAGGIGLSAVILVAISVLLR